MIPRKDLSQAAQFLHLLDNTTDQFTFQTFSESPEAKEQRDEYRKRTGNKTADPYAKVLHGTLDDHGDTLGTLNAAGAGIYVTVNRTDFGGRSEGNITAVRAVFADTDGAPLQPILKALPPHIVVDSSPGKWHVYWLVDGLERDNFKGVQQRIAELFGTDKSVTDLPRVMRLPGFLHLKTKPFLTRLQSGVPA